MNLIKLLAIGISLSMDSFSLALVLGMNNSKKGIYSLVVSLFHFLMPLLGTIIEYNLWKIFTFSSSYLLTFIYIFILFGMIINIKSKEKSVILNFYTMMVCAFAVSVDSFSVGLGIRQLTIYPFLAYSIFSICSFSFTYVGMYLGEKSYSYLGNVAKYIAIFIILSLLIGQLIFP